ncbi:MAG: hypothetical protein U1F76_04540 [Candidatus Competibacteraceae bacterium]
MPYFLEIYNNSDHYKGCIHQDDVSSAYPLPQIELGPGAQITIKGKSYILNELIQAIITFKYTDLETVFDERGQLELGQYLYKQTLGRRWQNASDLPRESDIQLHILSENEHILRLPWVLLACGGNFLSVSGWSVILGNSHPTTDCELPPSPHLLVVMPQPANIRDTEARIHLEELEEMLSQADHHFYQGKHLHVVRTWEEFQAQVVKQHFDLLYYYGHGIGDKDRSRLVFAADKTQVRKDVPIVDLATCLRQAPGGPPLLAYINCCRGDAGGLLGAGRQLLNLIPVVLTNRTVATIDAARRQAMDFWKAILLEGIPPHAAVAGMYSRLGNMGLSLKDVRWMTPVLHSRYRNWKANPPRPRNRLDQSPHWRLKLNRVRQFSQVAYQTGQMLRERKPRSLVYVWYGQKGQGMDLFHQRLAVELWDVLHGVYLYEIRPRWPDDLHNPHRSFEDMLLEAFDVDLLDHIPGRIRTQTQGESGRRILVYIRHQPLLPDEPIKPPVLRKYLEWWDYNGIPLLHQEIDAFGLLGISFEVRNPPKFLEVLEKNMDGLELRHTVLHVLDEMEQLAKKDLREFLDTHRIELPRSRRERILDEILKETGGHYEMTLEALKSLVERAWDLEDENKQGNRESEDEDY